MWDQSQVGGLGRDGHGRAQGSGGPAPPVSPHCRTWAGLAAGPRPVTGRRACHRGRCGLCGAAAWPRPPAPLRLCLQRPAGDTLAPGPAAGPAGRPSTVGMRAASRVDPEAEAHLVAHVHSCRPGRDQGGREPGWRRGRESAEGWARAPNHSLLMGCSPEALLHQCGCGSAQHRAPRFRAGARLSRWFGKRAVGPEGGAWGPVQGRELLEQALGHIPASTIFTDY